MRLELTDGEPEVRILGAAVVRSAPNGGMTIEFGPADGPAMSRLRLSHEEAAELMQALKSVSAGGDEAIVLAGE